MSECVFCQGGYRYPFMMSNGEIILLCEECSSIWLDPRQSGWGQGASDKVLRETYSVDDEEILFEGNSRWLTERDIRTLIDEHRKNGDDASKLWAFLKHFFLLK